MRALGLASLFMFVSSGCLAVEGNGSRSDELRPGAGFSEVANDSSLDVLVEQGDSFSITVSIDSNLLEHVDTHVSGGTLHIETNDWLRHVVPGPHVRVTVPHLLDARVSGSGGLDTMPFVETTPVELKVSGAGDLHFDGTAPQLTASVSGAGDLTVQGSAARLQATVSGAGDLDARELTVSSASLKVSGSGDLSATVNGPVDVSVSGAGDVDIFGAFQVASSHVHGGGDLHLHP